ncbi:hypothetical protein [Paenibacillus albus]|uniref:Uncharacterized protein n=1 Tax=Paenibacillus albus TaxID=2495582 RepID=A0A3S9AAC0_9BACL|nr:hypothetical protein [Paenibacillus albus]AZN42717.1 hypothetical protein EJC50_25770 [Paenibacillus albus]
MNQPYSTYTTEKLWQYQQQELERSIRDSEQIRQAKANQREEREQKTSTNLRPAARFKLPSYLSKWLLAKTVSTQPDRSECERGEQIHAE